MLVRLKGGGGLGGMRGKRTRFYPKRKERNSGGREKGETRRGKQQKMVEKERIRESW